MVWSCPQDTWRFPGQHMWPLFPLSALSSRTSLCFFWLWNRPLSTTVPKLHEHKAVFCSSDSISLDAWGWGGGHRQGIALLCYLANNSKSFCSLKSPFSQQGFPPLFFSSLSYRCCKVFFSFPQQFPTSGPVLSLYIFWVEVNIKGECRETG